MAYAKKLKLTSVRNVDVGTETIKGFVNRSFTTTFCFRVNDRYTETRIKFLLGVHLIPDGMDMNTALVEVKYGVLPSNGWEIPQGGWRPIDAKTWCRFFGMIVEDEPQLEDEPPICDLMQRALTTLPDGKTPAFRCHVVGNSFTWPKRVGECIVSQFLDCWQVKFPIFLLYGDRTSSAQELNELATAMTYVRDVAYNIKYNKNENRKQESIAKLTELKANLKTAEDEFAKLLENAADAMNELSSQYGIEIDLNQAKKPSGE